MTDSLALLRLSGLLRSGLSLEKALGQLGDLPKHSKSLTYLQRIASHSGAALAEDIEFVSELVSFRERSSERIQVAHASPKATARLMLWLPIITLLMAEFLGWGVLSTVVDKPIILLSIVLGLALLLISKIITQRLVNKAKPEESFEGFYLVGVALLFSAGATLSKAQEVAGKQYLEVFRQEPAKVEILEMESVASLVAQTGTRVAPLLRKQALALQSQVDLAREIKIEKLGIKLMVPLGLGVLPAFVLMAIVPLMVTTLGSK